LKRKKSNFDDAIIFLIFEGITNKTNSYSNRQTAEIIKLKKELEMSRESLKVYERNILRKDEAIENLSKAFEKQREKTDLLRVMMEWKLKRQENAKEVRQIPVVFNCYKFRYSNKKTISVKTFAEKVAEKYYNNRVKLKAFLCWQYFIISKRKAKLEKACKKKAEEVCYELATKYETKIKTVRFFLFDQYCKYMNSWLNEYDFINSWKKS
jgi:centrosomal protein POC5